MFYHYLPLCDEGAMNKPPLAVFWTSGKIGQHMFLLEGEKSSLSLKRYLVSTPLFQHSSCCSPYVFIFDYNLYMAFLLIQGSILNITFVTRVFCFPMPLLRR